MLLVSMGQDAFRIPICLQAGEHLSLQLISLVLQLSTKVRIPLIASISSSLGLIRPAVSLSAAQLPAVYKLGAELHSRESSLVFRGQTGRRPV